MRNKDSHFWVQDVIDKLPPHLKPRHPSWDEALSGVVLMKSELGTALNEVARLSMALQHIKAHQENICGEDMYRTNTAWRLANRAITGADQLVNKAADLIYDT